MRHYIKPIAACLLLSTALTAYAGLFDDLSSALRGNAKRETTKPNVTPTSEPSNRNLVVTQTNNASSDKRIALVIGNSSYANSPLKNPVNDAKDMAKKLRDLGFDVIERTNLQTKQIGRTLSEFRSKLTLGSVALVFYAGHGLQIKGDNYLPAVDADINTEEDVPNQSLAVKQIMDVLDESKTRLNLVFLDACRNNPYARSFRSSDRGLARVTAPSGTLISYATKPGSVAADGDGRNGLYTSKLLAQMDSNVQIEQALKRVVTEVKTASQGKQEPWMEGSIEGDFCFGGCLAADGTQVGSQVHVPGHINSAEEIEDDSWSAAEAANTVEAISAYLSGYPSGRYVTQARIKLATFKPALLKPAEPMPAPVKPTAVREDAETDLWNEVQKGSSIEDYRAYIDKYPKGKYVALAKTRIKKTQEVAQAAAEQQEQAAWQGAQEENSEASYSRYLKGYSNGRYAGLARARQEKLNTDLTAKEEAELWQRAESGNDKRAVESYLNRYPSGRYLAAASAKLQAIKEKEATHPSSNLINPLKIAVVDTERLLKTYGQGSSKEVLDELNKKIFLFAEKYNIFAEKYNIDLVLQKAVYKSPATDITDYLVKSMQGSSFDEAQLRSGLIVRKMAVVDIDALLRTSPQAVAAEKRIKAQFQPRDMEIKELFKRGENYEFQREQKSFRDDLNREKNKELAVVLGVLNKEIQSLAIEESTDLVLKEAVYRHPRIDITDRVLKRLK